AEETLQLLRRAREGDRDALNTLMARYLPRLQRWASGRLPAWARDLANTDDVVQDTVLHSLNHLGEFAVRREGALQAYLREAVLNRIKDEMRRASRRPPVGQLDVQHPGAGPSPLEEAIGQEMTDRYEKALGQLRPDDREAIIVRVELGGSYKDVAVALDKPTVDAARVAVARALVRLAEAMRDESAT
ncbi:MAG: RNA polymerase sigma factor, partial [Acidobacteriota bacterium]